VISAPLDTAMRYRACVACRRACRSDVSTARTAAVKSGLYVKESEPEPGFGTRASGKEVGYGSESPRPRREAVWTVKYGLSATASSLCVRAWVTAPWRMRRGGPVPIV